MLLRLPYGSSSIPAEIPDSSPCEVLQVRYPEASLQPESLIQQCLDNPVASPRLDELLVRGRRVAIVVDDGTRATPTPMLLRLLLQRLSQLGVDERQISVVIAYGAHRRHDDETTAALLGPDVVSRVQVVHHDAHDERNLVNVGTTKRGTPVSLNRVVVEADLRILTGSVKPHNQAGYTGGGKSIVPGVAGIDTILANHSSANVSHPRSVLGIIDGNPIREDINEVIERFVGPSFLINVIQNPAKEIVGAVSGHPVAAHAQAAATLDSMCKVDTSVLADVVIVGCPDLIGINLYQTMNAMSAPVRVESPVVKLGGHIIVVSRCREGVGHPAFLECVRSSSSVGELHDKVTRPDEVMLDRYAAQIWAETLLYADVVIVTEGVDPQTLEEMHVRHADTVEQALDMCAQPSGRIGPITAIPDAPYVIPHYTGRD